MSQVPYRLRYAARRCNESTALGRSVIITRGGGGGGGLKPVPGQKYINAVYKFQEDYIPKCRVYF